MSVFVLLSRAQEIWGQFLALLHNHCVTLSKSLCLFASLLPPNEDPFMLPLFIHLVCVVVKLLGMGNVSFYT